MTVMFKLYVGALNGADLYKESENKQELVEAYHEFCKTNTPAVVQLMDETKNISEELQHNRTRVERLD